MTHRKESLHRLAASVLQEGGPGSGNFGHAGRPGEVGGSAPGSGNWGKETVTFNGRSVVLGAKKLTREDGIKYGIPKEVRRSAGEVPNERELGLIKGAWKAAKSPLGYVFIPHLVKLTGIETSRLHKILVHLTRRQQARLNVDRWGEAVFVKLLDRRNNE